MPNSDRPRASFRVRQESNPQNRFESTRVDWEDGVELPQTVRVHKETARSIVTENDSPDIPFRYSVNPYRGCAHACAYCYARPTHEYLGLGAGTDFDTQIFAKVNAPELLRRKLGSRSWSGEAITFSGVTDCYQPAERELKLTRACLEVCLEFRNPVYIITKSALVLRDLDLLTALAETAGVGVAVSIPFLDEKAARIIEPFAAPIESRFKTLEKLGRAGLETCLSISPVIPGLNDSDIPALLSRAKDCGVQSAFYVLLRLPGSVREVFLERIRAGFPEKAGKIEHHIRETRGGGLYQNGWGDRMAGSGTMAEMVEKLFDIHVRRLGIDGEAKDEAREHKRASLEERAWRLNRPTLPGITQASPAAPPNPSQARPATAKTLAAVPRGTRGGRAEKSKAGPPAQIELPLG